MRGAVQLGAYMHFIDLISIWASLKGQSVGKRICLQWVVRFLGREDPLEKERATHSGIFA